jgi:SAM-dependent methyltransferase
MSFVRPLLNAAPAFQALLSREQAMLAPILASVYGVWGLNLQPFVGAPGLAAQHLLPAVLNLAVSQANTLDGALRCAPDHLPFANASFQLVVAQHVFEQVDSVEDCAMEIERVLAAEGVMLIFGFNPVSLWRPWLKRKVAKSGPALRFHTPGNWEAVLARHQLDVLQVRYTGLWTPWTGVRRSFVAGKSTSRLARYFGWFGASWLILARKRRSTLTPLRLRATKSDLNLKPSLVPGARRECA